jgi:hypothetical protein
MRGLNALIFVASWGTDSAWCEENDSYVVSTTPMANHIFDSDMWSFQGR